MIQAISETPDLSYQDLITKIANQIFETIKGKTSPDFPYSMDIPIILGNKKYEYVLLVDPDKRCSLRLKGVGSVGLGITWENLSELYIISALEDLDVKDQ
jgi:hypothetical protein